ncbi:MAG: LysR family transcriptional regulator [Pseudolysinimonas sp.]
MRTAGFTLRQLEYFEAAAAEGSLTAAAARCQVTPSALTFALDDLERHLRVQLLLRRKGRGVTLTPAGTRMLVHARGVIRGAEALGDAADFATSTISGRFAIGCFTTLTPFFASAVVKEFQHNYPDVELDLRAGSASELHEQLLQGRIDVAVAYSVDVPASLSFEPLLRYRPHVLVAASHPLAARHSVSLGEFVSEPLIVLDLPPTAQNTRAMFQSLGLTPRVGATSTSYEAVRCMVGAELGYAVMFQQPASAFTYDGHTVCALAIADPVAPAIVGLARPRGAVPTARDEALRSFLTIGSNGGDPILAR